MAGESHILVQQAVTLARLINLILGGEIINTMNPTHYIADDGIINNKHPIPSLFHPIPSHPIPFHPISIPPDTVIVDRVVGAVGNQTAKR